MGWFVNEILASSMICRHSCIHDASEDRGEFAVSRPLRGLENTEDGCACGLRPHAQPSSVFMGEKDYAL